MTTATVPGGVIVDDVEPWQWSTFAKRVRDRFVPFQHPIFGQCYEVLCTNGERRKYRPTGDGVERILE